MEATKMTHYYNSISNRQNINITGNIIDCSWYNAITTKSGNIDHTAITVFSEIVYWYRLDSENKSKFKSDTWQTSYRHFERKFGYYHEKTRRAIVRLEELGFIKREFRTVSYYGQNYHNSLFIHLSSKALELLNSKNVEGSTQSKGDIYKYKKNIENRSIEKISKEVTFESNFISHSFK